MCYPGDLVSVERIIFVVGLSGAGKSQTMKTLEDLGYYCIDHLPPALFSETLQLLNQTSITHLALTLDVRAAGALGDARTIIHEAGVDNVVLFVDARDDVVIRRYSESRRRHPYIEEAGSLREAIVSERITLAPLRECANLIIDTTDLTHSELKSRLLDFSSGTKRTHPIRVTIVAFGFKYGIPLDIDMLFDARFLKNPNYVDGLRDATGLDSAVAAYIEQDPDTAPFLDRLRNLFALLIPRFITEGKSQLTIAIGCTGGRHRSVYIANRLVDDLTTRFGLNVQLELRDADRN